jgi:hypothetical protein
LNQKWIRGGYDNESPDFISRVLFSLVAAVIFMRQQQLRVRLVSAKDGIGNI